MNSEVFRKAAEIVGCDSLLVFEYMEGGQNYSCQALRQVTHDSIDLPELGFYTQIFKPELENMPKGSHVGWWGYPCEETQLARHLALLFAAEMIEDGEG